MDFLYYAASLQRFPHSVSLISPRVSCQDCLGPHFASESKPLWCFRRVVEGQDRLFQLLERVSGSLDSLFTDDLLLGWLCLSTEVNFSISTSFWCDNAVRAIPFFVWSQRTISSSFWPFEILPLTAYAEFPGPRFPLYELPLSTRQPALFSENAPFRPRL